MTLPHNPAGACHCGMTHFPGGSGRLTDTTDPTDLARIRAMSPFIGAMLVESMAREIEQLRAEVAEQSALLDQVNAAYDEAAAQLAAARRTEAETKAAPMSNPQVADFVTCPKCGSDNSPNSVGTVLGGSRWLVCTTCHGESRVALAQPETPE